jgi:hypothetical protein
MVHRGDWRPISLRQTAANGILDELAKIRLSCFRPLRVWQEMGRILYIELELDSGNDLATHAASLRTLSWMQKEGYAVRHAHGVTYVPSRRYPAGWRRWSSRTEGESINRSRWPLEPRRRAHIGSVSSTPTSRGRPEPGAGSPGETPAQC